jgi:two-component system, OmpR family, phosphate regulon response regulator PhoB
MLNKTALIIEDEIDLAVLFAEALNHANYDTHIVNDGFRAQAELLDLRPSLVVLDLHLPVVSGAEVLAFIRAEPRLIHTRVIVASADERSVKLVEEQADLTLIKPITFTQLRDFALRFYPQEIHAA